MARGIETAFKVNRHVMANLMPVIKEVKCIMCPLDGGVSRGAKEVMRVLQSRMNKEANPDAKVEPEFLVKAMWPRIEVTYATGNTERWYAHKLAAQDLLSEIFMHAQLAENEIRFGDGKKKSS